MCMRIGRPTSSERPLRSVISERSWLCASRGDAAAILKGSQLEGERLNVSDILGGSSEIGARNIG